MIDDHEGRPRDESANITQFDIVADLRGGAARNFTDLLSLGRSRNGLGRLTCIHDKAECPQGSSGDGISLIYTESPIDALATAVAVAARDRHHLLVLLNGSLPAADVVDRLEAAFDADPMIGIAIPRILDSDGAKILPIEPPEFSDALVSYNRDILTHCPEFVITPEFVAVCMLLRAQLVANLPPIDTSFRTLEGALRKAINWGRRCGYRPLIVNRAIISQPLNGPAHPVLEFDEQRLLASHYADFIDAEEQLRRLPYIRREALLGRILSPLQLQRQRLLFDCRGMADHHNGTNECMLGILDGVMQLNTGWTIDVLVSKKAATFNRMLERYSNFNFRHDHPSGSYSIAARLSQPWNVKQMLDLHRHAQYIVINMLDTIAWDIIFASNPNVEASWSFAARYCDGIIFPSQFTQQRFNFRFAPSTNALQAVTYLSCHPDEYEIKSQGVGSDGNYILLIGNGFDHKGIEQAIDILATSFPYERFVVVGLEGPRQSNVEAIASGQIEAMEMEQLYARARMLVMPSYYEGFGFPIVRGLAYGLDVVARRSALLNEIASICPPKGRVLPFDDPLSLIVTVGRILAGESVETVPVGQSISPGAEPLRWRDVAKRMFDLFHEMMQTPSTLIHDQRESALQLVFPGN